MNKRRKLTSIERSLAYRNMQSTRQAGIKTGGRSPIHGWGNPIQGKPQTSKLGAYGWAPHPEASGTIPRRTTNPEFPPITGKVLQCSRGFFS